MPAPGSAKVKDEVICKLHSDGLDDEAMAAELGVTPAYVRSRRWTIGLGANRKPTRRKYDHDKIIGCFDNDHMNAVQISIRLGYPPAAVSNILRRYGRKTLRGLRRA